MGGLIALQRGGIYLARLDPAKGAEIGKLRPVIVLTDQHLLNIEPAHIFITPLSRRSNEAYASMHVALPARDNLHVQSFALVEHCRAISIKRIQSERLAQLHSGELGEIVHRLQRLIGL